MNADGTPVATVPESLLFSDTALAVQAVYSGSIPAEIRVMQTGGASPVTGQVEGPIDDPLYAIGEVYVLFLVDASGDPIQALDRELYRIVSPAGRFKVVGTSVRSFSLDGNLRAVQPVQLDDLLMQIRQAVP